MAKNRREHSIRMLGVEYCWASRERAKALGLDFKLWKKVMIAGCLVNQPEISQKARQLADIVEKGNEAIIQTPAGIDLKLKLAGRKPNIGDSIVTKQDAAQGIVKFLPSGLVEASADEGSAEGIVVYDVPILVGAAKRVEGLRLKFRQGKIVEYSASSGIDAFENYVETSQGDANTFGFFGVGLNPGLKYGYIQDDKVLGVVTIGIGGNEDKGGRNRTVGNRNWWAVTTKATLRIDGETILENGKLDLATDA
jgi:leucyl aminopeptidase (aminopeptidase T)